MSRKTEKNGALPEGWRRVRLGEIYNISASGDFDAKESSRTQNEKHPYPVYSNALTNKGLHSYSTYSRYDEDSITITARGDIGFANHRKTKFMAIGRLLVLKNKIPVSNEFVCEYINHSIRFFKETTGVPQLTVPQASKYYITLPPFPDQKAIASLLEKWDVAIEKTEALIAAKEKQFKWLLKRLIRDQQDNPEWRKVRLGRVGTFYTGKGIKKSDLVEYGIPCLRYAEIYTKYDGIVNELSSSVSPYAATKATPIQAGDIIFAASGETVAEIGKAIAFVGLYPAVAGGDTIIFRNHGQESAYLAHVLNSADVARQKARLGKGQSVVHIHIPELFQVEVPLPPLHEQRKIAEILATWDTSIEKTKALAEQYRIQKRGLMQKLLTGKWRINANQGAH